MSACARSNRTRRGFALPVAMMMGAVLFLVAGGLLHTVMSSSKGLSAGAHAEVAYWLARGGLVQAQRELAEDPDWGSSSAVETAVPIGDGEGRYAVRVLRQPLHFNDSWVVSATGTFAGSTRRLVAVLRPDTFSRYSFFTNSETTTTGSPIWFVGKDELQGPVFTNDGFHFYEDPTFRGRVGSVNPTYEHANATATEHVGEGQSPTLSPAPTLDQGFDGDQPPETTLSTEEGRDAAMAALQARATDGGLVLTGPQRLFLQGDTLSYAPIPGLGQATGQAVPVSIDSLASRVVFVDGDVTLDGTLDGRLTIASRGEMTIAGPIRYRFRTDHRAPQDDMLGLVSRDDIVIHAGVPHDEHIDASILALGESFHFQGNGLLDPTLSLRKGKLTIYGGIAQVRRGVMGRFNVDGIISGFDKDYQYDARLATQAPPWFPHLVQLGRPRLVTVSVRDMQSMGAQP